MFWNKAKITLVICCYFLLNGNVESLTDEKKVELCNNVPQNTFITHPDDKRAYILCMGTADPVLLECPAKQCFNGKQVMQCSTEACPKELTKSEMVTLCTDHDLESVAYTNDKNKFVLCLTTGPIAQECPIERCYDKSSSNSYPCNENACATSDFSSEIIQKYCKSSDQTWLQSLPDEDCEYYNICLGKNNDPLRQKCPPNQHYSRGEAKCTSPVEAACSDVTAWCMEKKNGVKFASLKCHEYYECFNQMTVSKSCPYNQYFDKIQNSCVNGVCQDNYGNDVIRKPECTPSNEGVYQAHPKCYMFYVCLNGKALQGQCSSGYFFDAKQSDCVRDSYNDCKDA